MGLGDKCRDVRKLCVLSFFLFVGRTFARFCLLLQNVLTLHISKRVDLAVVGFDLGQCPFPSNQTANLSQGISLFCIFVCDKHTY